MPNPKFTKTEIAVIVGFFVLYALSYAWLIEPKPKREVRERTKQDTMMMEKAKPRTRTEGRRVKSLPGDSGLDEASYYQDHLDEYLDDPEDEVRFPPEIFDANED